MYHASTSWVEQTKFIVREMLNAKTFVLEGVITSVDPNPPCKAKVLLEPYGIETGWLRVAAPLTNPAFSLVLPCPVVGTTVKVIFDMGDIKNGTIIGALQAQAPNVPANTIGLYHNKTGSSILIDDNGAVTIKGTTVTIEGDLRTNSTT